MENKTLTLTVREILDLAKATGLIIQEPDPIDNDDMETEFTIIEQENGVEVRDEDESVIARYPHGACITDYPEEGMYPLGEKLSQ